jgi:predicted Zn-dependent protease
MPQPLKIIILVFLLTACATTPISNRQALILIPEWQEIQFGKQAYKKALKDQKDSENAHLNRMLRRVGRRIAKVSDMPNLDWEFRLIESKDQKCFCPAGRQGRGLYRHAGDL